MDDNVIDSKANEYVNFFLSKLSITNLALNKLLYITQCVTYTNPAFEYCRLNITFKAMRNGPIYPILYNEKKTDCDNNFKLKLPTNQTLNLNQDETKLLTIIVDKYKKMGPWEFIKFIHRVGGAWRNACKDFVLPDGIWDEKRFALFKEEQKKLGNEKAYIDLSLDDMKVDGEMFLIQ